MGPDGKGNEHFSQREEPGLADPPTAAHARSSSIYRVPGRVRVSRDREGTSQTSWEGRQKPRLARHSRWCRRTADRFTWESSGEAIGPRNHMQGDDLSTGLNHSCHFCCAHRAFKFSHATEYAERTKDMYLGWVTAQKATFLSLQSAVFCAECELISENNTSYCLACGSKAMLSLSRVLGGSLKRQETAHLIADVELDRLVRDLLRTVPEPIPFPEKKPAASVAMHAGRHHLRTVGMADFAHGYDGAVEQEPVIQPAELNLEPGINIIAE